MRGHVEAHRENGDAAVLGRIDWDPEIEVTPVMDWLVRSGRWYEFDRLERKPPGAHAFYSTNISLPRSSLLEVGGFDERFPIYYEDLDLGLRLADRGVDVRYRPELAAFHAHEIDLEESLQRAEAVGRSANLLNRIHAHRTPLPAPHPAGIKADVGRAMARLARASRVGARTGRAHDLVLRGAHYSAFARGYLTRPLPDSPALAPRPEGRPPARPSVSVIVPFAGERSAADAALGRLGELRLQAGDEVVVADNSGGRVPEEGTHVRVVDASAMRSSYFARNVGAEVARGEWLLFVDADCAPSKDLIDDYFSEPIPDAQGIVAGNIVGAPEQRGWVARYARSRRHQSPDALLRHPFRPFGITGNLLVRKAAWAEVGGVP